MREVEINCLGCFWSSAACVQSILLPARWAASDQRGEAVALRLALARGAEQMESDSTKTTSSAAPPRPALDTRTSSGSQSQGSDHRHSPSSSPSLSPQQLSPTQIPTSFPFRSTGYIPSPMGSVGTSKRGRQSSLSSNVSSAPTDATSLDEAEEDCLEEEEEVQEVQPIRRSSSIGRIAGQKSRTGLHSANSPTEHHNHSVHSLPLSTTHGTSPPTSAIPISISTNVAAVRLSTTPLIPSPLAQASGPHEEVEHLKGDDGDDSDEEVYTRMGRRRTATMEDSPLRREPQTLFGGMLSSRRATGETSWLTMAPYRSRDLTDAGIRRATRYERSWTRTGRHASTDGYASSISQRARQYIGRRRKPHRSSFSRQVSRSSIWPRLFAGRRGWIGTSQVESYRSRCGQPVQRIRELRRDDHASTRFAFD